MSIVALIITPIMMALGSAESRTAPEREAATVKTTQAPQSTKGPAQTQPKTDAARPTGELNIDITDILGRDLPAKVELRGPDHPDPIVIDVPAGRARGHYPAGRYKAYAHVYDNGVPLLVEVKDVTLREDQPAFVLVNLDLGAGGNRPLRHFDQDFDLAIDRVELSVGTDPYDARSIPGVEQLPFDEKVLDEKTQWYRGELHAHSSYGAGAETVAQLVRRAQKARLDFLAITDRNTMAACMDPDFHSDRVVLIPAMEWGTDDMGVALIYGPRTFPELTTSAAEAQATALRVQAQGGIFAVAHPCFSSAPWRWGLSHVNAVEVWCRDWRAVPPMWLELLNADLRATYQGKYRHSIALAAATVGMSANGQAALFWDSELKRGLKASPIAGSMTSSPKVPMASPVTYVFAVNKSLPGILDGLRRGRTFVSSGLDGPILHFSADVLAEKDIAVGGLIPLGMEARFTVGVKRAKGKKLEVFLNGHPIFSKTLKENSEVHRFRQTPQTYSVYRVRVVEPPSEMAFGQNNVLAMSSPIYAQDIIPVDPERSPADYWLRLKNESLPPLYTSDVKTEGAKTWVRIGEDAYRRSAIYNEPLPVDPRLGRGLQGRWRHSVPPPMHDPSRGRELRPQWKY